MKIKDRFRGLNLVDDPTELDPGESLVCNDLYLKGKSLVNREKAIKLPIISEDIVATHLAENVSTTLAFLFLFDINRTMRIYIYAYSDGSWTEFPDYAQSLSQLDPTQVRFLEWSDKIIAYDQDSEYIFNKNISPNPWVHVPTQNIYGAANVVPSGTNADRPSFKGVRYLVEFTHSYYGYTGYFIESLVPLAGIFIEKTFASGQHAVLTLTLDTFIQNPLTLGYDTVNLYRKIIYDDDSEDDQYYFIKRYYPLTPPGVSVVLYDDVSETGIDYFDLTRVNGDNLIDDLPDGKTIADWYNGRVVWATKYGTVSFSYLNNPFKIVGTSKDSVVSSSATYPIVNLLNYFGTLIIFTQKGIYHLVGLIADDQINSTYQFYYAVPDLRCYYVPKILLIENLIYFLAEDGLYNYDARTFKPLGGKIRPIWYEQEVEGASLAYDLEKKLILVCIPGEQVLVYHFSDQFKATAYEAGQAGEWTTWDLKDADLILNINRPITGGKVLSLIPAFISGDELYYLYGQESVDDTLTCEWRSNKLGGDLTIKRWGEIRTRIEGTYSLKIDDEEIYSDSIEYRYVPRGRIKKRSDMITLSVESEGPVRLVDFDIEAEKIGD